MLKISRNLFNRSRLGLLSWLGVAGIVSCFAIMLTFGVMLFPSLPDSVQAEEGDSSVSTYTTGTSVSIGIPSTIAFDAVTPTASGATTTANASLTITTTNSAGYSLYLYSSDGNNSLTSINPANTSTVDAITGGVGLTLSSLEPNTWGYNLGTAAPTADTTYNAVPTSNAEPIQTKDTSSTNSANDTYTLSFGAKVDTSIPSGTYNGTLTVAVVAEPALVTIAFDGNGATGGSMSNQQIVAGQSANLNTNQYTRDGYVFAGWNTNTGGTGTSYADGASYAAPIDSAGQTITLYAQWRLPINLLDDVTYMQDLTASHCANSDNGVTATLRDKRDNNSYTIAKINGNCWMTQNLRLSGGRTLTSADSNVASSWSFPSTELAGNSYSYTAPQSTISSNTSYGGYYNFCAASAGTNCQTSTTTNTTYDICPKGWRLPTRSEQSGIAGTSYVSAFSPVYSGYYNDGSLGYTGSRGYWWSSTAYNSNYQYILSYYSGSLGTSNYGKRYGISVRCVRSS